MSFSTGDIIFHEAMLGGVAGSVDIARRIRSLSTFHSVTKPYSMVEMTVLDTTDIINKSVGLFGNNTFSVSFSQPGQTTYDGNWIITSVEKGESVPNQRGVVYQMTGYSPHMLNIQKVQRSFRDNIMTDAISQIINQVLQPQKALSVLAAAKNMTGNQLMPYNINGVQVFKAIRQLMLGSASSLDQSSAYVLYETRTNLVLDTLEHMLTRIGDGPTYFQRPLGINFLNDQVLQQFNIIAYQENSRVDATNNIEGDNQSTRVFDLFSNIFNATQFGSGPPAAFASLAYNSMRTASFAQDFMAARSKIANQFDSQSITVQAALNPELDIGSGVNIDLLAPLGDTQTPVPATISGPMLISELRHTINLGQRGMQGVSTFRACRGPTLGFL